MPPSCCAVHHRILPFGENASEVNSVCFGEDEPLGILAFVGREPDLLPLRRFHDERQREAARVIRDLEVVPRRERHEPDQAIVVDVALPRDPLRVGEHDREAERVPPVEGTHRGVDRRQIRRVASDTADLEPAQQDTVALRAPGERTGVIDREEAGEIAVGGVERPRAAVGDERDGLGCTGAAGASTGERRAVGQARPRCRNDGEGTPSIRPTATASRRAGDCVHAPSSRADASTNRIHRIATLRTLHPGRPPSEGPPND